MTFNVDNLIFFYLTGAIILLAMSLIVFAAIMSDRRSKKTKHR